MEGMVEMDDLKSCPCCGVQQRFLNGERKSYVIIVGREQKRIMIISLIVERQIIIRF